MPRNKNLENRLGLEGKKVILFLGKFQRWENLDKLVEIFAKIKKNRDSTILLLVGDGPEREKIERKIKALGLEGYIKITGFISFDETPEYYNLCDVFVIVREDSPLTDTTTPIKPLEVMACGKVVVSTDVGGLREVIEDGKTGFLVKSQEGVLVMIISLLDDQKKLNKIGSEAREYVQQEREWGVIIKSFSESLTELKK
jgi:glycosyltransferase involved in cell wall biosynthesis